MKLWIDVLTPKQALFTNAMIKRAPSKIKITVTTRHYSELDSVLKLLRLRHTTLGRHGGGELLEKLKASVERQLELTRFVSENSFDASFSFLSPEAARVSFGIGIKHYLCSDSPHAIAPAKLTVPLASGLFSPFPISKERWAQYGLKKSLVFAYHALDPWAWLISMQRKEKIFRKRPRILIRLEESFASYMRPEKGISDLIEPLLQIIMKEGDFEIILIPRYDEQRAWAMKEFGTRVKVPSSAVNGPELVSEADVVIGGGGTMTQEAALLGIPNISYFPSTNLDVFENFYFPRKLSIKASTHRELLTKTKMILRDLGSITQEFALTARRATKNFEDPVKFILRNIQAN